MGRRCIVMMLMGGGCKGDDVYDPYPDDDEDKKGGE
jgi:hypothetical protein